MNMNIIINNCKRTVANFLKNADNLSRRCIVTVADYGISWNRPEKVSPLSPKSSGDKGLKINVKPTDFANGYDKSPEMKDASDIVKRMFTLHFLPSKETKYMKRKKVIDLVKRNELDNTSPETRIANYTSEILELQEFITKYSKNPNARVRLNAAIGQRRKWLTHLRTWDYRRFEWVLEKLNLVYKPPISPPLQVTRKESLNRLTRTHCRKIVHKKLNIYKNELKALQKNFYIEKAEKLAFIREEELACGLQPSVSEEDIAKAKEKVKYQI